MYDRGACATSSHRNAARDSMCISFVPPEIYSFNGTWLVLAPLEAPAGRWFLTYINSADTPKPDHRKWFPSKTPAMLMVVPVPNPGNQFGELDYMLSATEGVSDMQKAVAKGFKAYDPEVIERGWVC